MRIRYKISLVSSKFSKSLCLQEDKAVQIGTQHDCDVILPPLDKIEGYCFTLYVQKGKIVAECTDDVYFSSGKKRMVYEIPATFELIHESSGDVIAVISADLNLEKKIPQFSYAYELPYKQRIKIGGAADSSIQIHDHALDRVSVTLFRNGSSPQLLVDHVQYGTYLNGEKISGTCLLPDPAFFMIDGYEFYYRSGYLYCDSHVSLTVPNTWKRIDNIFCDNHLEYPKFNRSPRFLAHLNTSPIEILAPEPKQEPRKTDLVMSVLPALIMLIVTILLRGVLTGGGLYIIISAISMSLGIFTSIYAYFKNKKETIAKNNARKNNYLEYIKNKEAEIEQARLEEQETLCQIYRNTQADIDAVWNFSTQLFDRKADDTDFLQVYLGSGMQLAKREITFKKQESILPGDDLMQLPGEIAIKYRYIGNAPIVSDFRTSNVIGIVGSSNRLESFICNLTIDICTRHLNSDVSLFYMIHTKTDTWLRWLPHVYNRDLGVRNIVCSEESRVTLLEYLYSRLAERERTKCTMPHYILFVEKDQQLKKHPLYKYLSYCANLGLTVVFLELYRELLPDTCDEVIDLDRDTATGTIARRAEAPLQWKFSYSLIDETTAKEAALRLAPIYCEEISVEGSLPRSYSFFDSFGIVSAESLPIRQNWSMADVSKSLAAPIGINSKGELVVLDIHEKAHGPHGLIAGTTGSGKSEFLQSYIAAMSVIYSPQEVAFLIIDFKGGGMANQLKNLPHLVGTITNIDGREIARSLRSIKAELDKRQRLFDSVKVNHIDKYIKSYKSGYAKVPLPHLVIVVDEFAELKTAQPEFMAELISAARIGRSLGIHLILATQKPAGQINDQIWSNSRFHICFKVQTHEDSNEMLKSPLASEIKEPGRGYLQVGNNEIFELFQSAYSGGSVQNEAREISDQFKLAEVSLWGEHKVIYDSSHENQSPSETASVITQLGAVITTIERHCREEGPGSLPGICLPALPDKLPFPASAMPKADKRITTYIGVYDDPAHQAQGSIEIDLTSGNLMLIGSSQSGKTTAIQTIIRSLSERYTSEEVNLYVLDFASMILTNFEDLAHVGGVAVSSEEEKVKNLFKLLLSEMAARKNLMLKSGVGSFSSYLDSGKKDLPQIILFLDNFTAFREIFDSECDTLLKLCREGTSAGITVVIANATTTGLGYKYMSNFAHRIAFFCHDAGEYSSLYDYCRASLPNIPGRGLIRLNNELLEFQGYQSFAGKREIEEINAVKNYIAECNQKTHARTAKRIPLVPELIIHSHLCVARPDLFKNSYTVPAGMNFSTVEYESIDLTRVGALGICGREGMGQTNLIMHILRTLQENILRYDAEVYIVDDQNQKLQQVEDYGCVVRYTANASDAIGIVEELYETLQARKEEVKASGIPANEAVKKMPLLLLVLSGSEALQMVSSKSAVQEKLIALTKELSFYHACVIVTRIENERVPYSGPILLKALIEKGPVFVFEDMRNIRLLDVTNSLKNKYQAELRPGDGYLWQEARFSKIRTVSYE